MTRLRDLPISATVSGWAYAILAGLVSSGLVVVQYQQSASNTLHLESVFVVSVLGGVLYHGRQPGNRTVGFRTGLVASLPVLWLAFSAVASIPELTQPAWFGGVQVVLSVVWSGLMVGICVMLGLAGVRVGDWLVGTVRRSRSFAADP